MRSGEEARRRSPHTRLTCPQGDGYGTDADIKPDFLRAEDEAAAAAAAVRWSCEAVNGLWRRRGELPVYGFRSEERDVKLDR